MNEATRTWATRIPLAVLAVLAAGFLALGLAEARADAPTFDEPVYVSAGLAAVVRSASFARPGADSQTHVPVPANGMPQRA